MREDLENDKLNNLADFYYHERLPAWTDRILYKLGPKSKVDFKEYNSLNEVYISDHKYVFF